MQDLPIRPGAWVVAAFEHVDPNTLECAAWESDRRGSSPSAMDLLAAPIRALHLVLGGHPALLDGRVRGTEFSEIAGIEGGTIRRMTLRPLIYLRAEEAREKWAEALDGVEKGMRSALGALGLVETSETEDGTKRLVVGYGPAFVASAGSPIALPTSGRIVDLGPVAMRPRGRALFQ